MKLYELNWYCKGEAFFVVVGVLGVATIFELEVDFRFFRKKNQ